MLVFLLFLILNFVSCAIQVDDLPSYFHHRRNSSDNFNFRYVLHEQSPSSSFLCPRGFFISKVQYKLIHGTSNSSRCSSGFTHDLHNRNASIDLQGLCDACPRLSMCLGYQACLFKFGIEFCGFDADPGRRKALNVTIACANDRTIPVTSQQRNKSRHTVLLHYKSTRPTNMMDFVKSKITPVELLEEEVFDVSCPNLENVIDIGYRGNCTEMPPSNVTVSEDLWHILARIPQSSCRKQVKQVYCSLKYNSNGFCVPPQFVDTKTAKWNVAYGTRSLPKRGFRPIGRTEIPGSFTPAKLGFAILFHENVPAVIQLLSLIYRPDNFYVLHVDVHQQSVRDELVSFLSSRKMKNVKVLPKDRSFVTSWGSYEIGRAFLECYEELLRIGFWDFVINLSGSDLPIRNMDDLGFSLAAHRGHSFVPYQAPRNSPKNERTTTYETAFYSCGGYVYNVSGMSAQPSYSDIKIHVGSTWGVYARELVEYVLNVEQRDPILNKYQFYLQLNIIPDELYMLTAAYNSPYRHKIHTVAMHSVKLFIDVNDLNLCRHTDDADFCGLGPGIVTVDDIPSVEMSAHKSYFMRKFSTSDVNDPTRLAVIEMLQHGYYENLMNYLPTTLLRQIVSKVVLSKYSFRKYKIKGINDVNIFPNLSPSHPSCSRPFYSGLETVSHYDYRIDFSATNLDTDESEHIQSLLHANPSHRCFSAGHLRMIYATTWTTIDPSFGRTGLHSSIPIPYNAAEEESVWIQMFFHVSQTNENGQSTMVFDDLDITGVTASPLNAKVELRDARGKTVCLKTIKIRWNNHTVNYNNHLPLADRDEMVLQFSLQCAHLQSGLYVLHIFKADVNHPYIYKVPMYLLNVDNLSDDLADDSPHLDKVAMLWTLKDSSVVSEKKLNHSNDAKFDRHCKPSTFGNWLRCHGGIITIFLTMCTICYWLSQTLFSNGPIRKSTRKRLNLFIVSLLIACMFQYHLQK
ncbi:Uncharacterised protein g6840 [Pycnogonum litorale]